jgi:hypothetical protein
MSEVKELIEKLNEVLVSNRDLTEALNNNTKITRLNNKENFKPEEAAEFCQVSCSTINRAMASGELNYTKHPKLVFISKEDCGRWMRGQKTKSAPSSSEPRKRQMKKYGMPL